VHNSPTDLSDRELAELIGATEFFDIVPAEFWQVAREFLAAPEVTR
jgi:hypothetical protein